jgi:hypothetical protein
MSWIPSFDTMVGWIFHVPDSYELLWWVLICVCWFGIVSEYRIKKLQAQLDDLAAKDTPPPRSER